MNSSRGRTVARLGIALALLSSAAALQAQRIDHNTPFSKIEQYLSTDTFRIIDWRDSRAPGDRTHRVALQFDDSSVVVVKWANAPRGGGVFNNEPRYELGAYVLQKLFLPDDEYVVPPTVARVFPLAEVRGQVPQIEPTFGDDASVLVIFQYWMPLVDTAGYWNEKRSQSDTVYARYIGNLNLLTYLIRHSDSNIGNFLISTVADAPRVYSVDNGVAFRSQPSNRGTAWRDMRVKRVPAAVVERLRKITRADLDRALAVLVELESRNGQLVLIPPKENLAPGRGVRRAEGRVQLGLTDGEIGDIERRLRSLLQMVDRGQIKTF